MAFKFAARTLLELGKELISSDEVAIYELIKNAVDAKSARIGIQFNINLLRSDYDEAIDSLKKGKNVATVKERLKEKLIVDTSTKSRSELLEVIDGADNSISLSKALSEAYLSCNWIEFRDEGIGMSLHDLDEIYLTVGTRSKRKENLKGANYLGDKGVGRLSAMRLGDRVSVLTTKRGEKRLNILDIDWTKFGHDVEGEVGDVNIDPELGPVKSDPHSQGTTIRITGLSSDWTQVRVLDLLGGAIARMVDPFQGGRGNDLLHVMHNGVRLLVPSIPPLLLRSAHAVCTAQLAFKNGKPVFKGVIDYKYRDRKASFEQTGAELYSITQKVFQKRGKKGHAATVATAIRPEAIEELGPFEVEIYWYNRRTLEAVAGLTGKASETKDLIANWSGGVMLYRNGFRVLPYGEPDDDWLELDKEAFGGSGFLLNRQQLLGRVTVHSAHTALSEQTNREGLIKSEASDALVAILKWMMHVEFRDLLREANKEDSVHRRREAEERRAQFRHEQTKLDDRLDELGKKIPAGASTAYERVKASVHTVMESCDEAVARAEKALKDADDEREQFVYLAGIGLMTEFIFHELDRAIRHVIAELTDARKRHPGSSSLVSLEQQLITLQKRVSAFDEMTGEKRQTKTKFEVGEVIKTVIASHAREFERHGITYEFQPKSFEIRAVKGMLIQIIENLVTNSVYWLKQQVRIDESFEPTIKFTIDPKSKILEVSDNGPGVAPDRRERIFEPFVSSKPTGQGRGLGLYICRELATYHDWVMTMSDNVGEFRPNRLNTFILNFKGEKNV